LDKETPIARNPFEKLVSSLYFPVGVTLVVGLAYLIWRLWLGGWDPVNLANIGTRFLNADPQGTEGYDGQFAFFMALEPRPSEVAQYLDVPAYRYQRILYPIVARILGLGKADFIAWTLPLLNLFIHCAAVYLLSRHLRDIDVPVRYSLIYGLWAGVVAGIGNDLFEPLAYGLVVAAYFARSKGKHWLGYGFLALAILSKEVVILFWLGMLVPDLLDRNRKKKLLAALMPAVTLALWQAWLWLSFGEPGIGSGGAMATSFELIPFMGFLRIESISMAALGLYAIIFGPTLIFPTIYFILAALRALKGSLLDRTAWPLLFNGLLIAFLPFSTFREPLGILRLGSGLVLSVVYFSARHKHHRALNFALFWGIFLVMILR
jgi:hypothetical protein